MNIIYYINITSLDKYKYKEIIKIKIILNKIL